MPTWPKLTMFSRSGKALAVDIPSPAGPSSAFFDHVGAFPGVRHEIDRHSARGRLKRRAGQGESRL